MMRFTRCSCTVFRTWLWRRRSRRHSIAPRSNPLTWFCTKTPGHRALSSAPASTLPDHANVVVIGGGILGTSVAYHLAKLGVPDVILLERDQLTSGTTWHAAGLMNSFGSMSSTSTWMRLYSQHLYQNVLPEETGLETGYMPVGFIELAADADRLEAYRRTAAYNRYLGVNVREISPQECQERFPLCDVSDILAGFYVPTDGRANPTDTTIAMAKGARLYGARIFEHIPVQNIVTEQRHRVGLSTVTGVVVDHDNVITANVVVNCAGMWARQLAQTHGVSNVCNQAAEHYYLITEAMPEVSPDWPVIEDSSRCVYIRPEGAGLMLGLFETDGAAWQSEAVPNFSFGEIEPDWDRMMPFVERAMARVPALQDVGVKKLFCGPESFTPDNAPMIGECLDIRNYYVAAGLNSLGILTGGGIGMLLARWIRDGHKPHDLDVTPINALRFHAYQSNRAYRQLRAGEALGNTYKVHYPDHQLTTCRNTKQSPLHDRLAAHGAYFRDMSGWEAPAWYAGPGEIPRIEVESFDRESWFANWAAEHRACRENVALFDMSFMSKFLVQGQDAGTFLDRLSTAKVNGDVGKIKYTQWLNEQGYMEADLTVTKLDDHTFLVVATDTMHNHVHNHMMRRIENSEHVFISDMTARYAQINLQGPRSRDLLQQIADLPTDLNFGDAREIELDLSRVWCMRITYVGELGYELFVPVEQARQVYDRIVEAGRSFNLAHTGLRALGSLRLEKGYRDYAHDMDNTDTIVECGLTFTCDFKKSCSFIGQEHVEAQQAESKVRGGLSKRMVNVLLNDSKPLMHHGEILWCNGKRVGDIRAASYGHTLGGAVGLSMIECDSLINKSFIAAATWAVEIGTLEYPCRVSLSPFYDPKNTRAKV